MPGSMITITAADGGEFEAYLVTPEQGSGPGLVLLQEIFGINTFLRDMAQKFADEGYAVLVPDLFWRMQPGIVLSYSDEDLQQAFDYYGRFDVDQGIKDVADTIAAFRGMSQCATGKVGALGYCLGGNLAYLTAARTDVDCSVSYYGVSIEQSLGEADDIICPMVMHFADEDGFVPPEAVQQITAEFKDRDEIQIYRYPGVDHAFATPGRDSYHEEFTVTAYSRSLALLRQVLGPN